MTLSSLGYTNHFISAFETFARVHSDSLNLRPARVIRQDRGSALAHDGAQVWAAENPPRPGNDHPGTTPAVGDWLVIEPRGEPPRARILDILPRRNRFARKTPGRQTQEQVIVANIDRLLIVVAMDVDFNIRRIERYLTIVQGTDIEPVIVLNKADLYPNPDEAMRLVRQTAPALDVLATSALTGAGVDAVEACVGPGVTAALVGSSGVGKSTFVNAILQADRQLVREVRNRDQRGQHTTTHRELIELPSGGILIDTPGMRELQLWADEAQVDAAFSDIDALAQGCRYRDCRHAGEPGCAISDALESGELAQPRWESYLKQLREIAHLDRRQSQYARLQEKAARREKTLRSRRFKKHNAK